MLSHSLPSPVRGHECLQTVHRQSQLVCCPRRGIPARIAHSHARVVRAVPGPFENEKLVQRERKTNTDVNTVRDRVKTRLGALLEKAGLGLDIKNGAFINIAPSSGVAASAEVQALRRKLEHAIEVMQEGLVERDAEVRLLLLAAMAGEHILLIGPPGTAKSEVGRRLNSLIQGAYFERLLTRFSVPEELFGPLSMRALEEDQYVRQVDGYLPTAEVAFIDEIFKANSAILNTLLTLINERLFDNGNVRQPVPLISMVGASNELPESEELDALYDRFLVRRQVRQVSPTGVAQMLGYYSGGGAAAAGDGGAGGAAASGSGRRAAAVDPSLRLTRDDILRCKAAALSTVRVPPGVIQLVTDLRSVLQEKMEPPVYVSDRRLVKSIQLLQVAAYCNGRDTVTEYDCLLLQHVLWQKPDQANKISDWILQRLGNDDGAKQSQYLLGHLFSRCCRSLGDHAKDPSLLNEVSALLEALTDKFQSVATVSNGGGFPVIQNNLWLSPEEAAAVTTSLGPKLDKSRAQVETVLHDAVVLDEAVRMGTDPVCLANLLPKYWADFIRNSEITEVRPIGTTPLAGAGRKP